MTLSYGLVNQLFERCWVAAWFLSLSICRTTVQGKYLASGGPPGARLNRYRGRYAEAEQRYGSKPNTLPAVAAYASLAQQAGLSPTELALR